MIEPIRIPKRKSWRISWYRSYVCDASRRPEHNPQPCAEAPDIAETIEPTFATPRNPAFQGKYHVRATHREIVAVWLFLGCSMPLAARAPSRRIDSLPL
jgi:hypothetical protein